MTKEELKEKFRDAEIDYDRAKKAIYIEYAKSNNPYKPGDIITDHVWSLKIEKITISIGWGESQCVYHGVNLKANGQPAKKQGRVVHQNNILKHTN